MSNQWHRYKQALAFLAVIVVTIVAVHVIESNGEEADCRRANTVFTELSGFLRDAAAAREADGQPAVAKQYRDRASRIENQIDPDC